MTLTEKVIELHRRLATADLPHAFGGALALAFCTAEPRGTKDIDVNVFIAVDRFGELVGALPPDVSVTDSDRRRLRRDAQSRLWWNDTPVDVFLSNHPFHDHTESRRRLVSFAGVDDLPVLACGDLAIFKTFFARPKDGVDVVAMAAVGAIDLDRLEHDVAVLLGGGDERRDFFARVRDDLSRST